MLPRLFAFVVGGLTLSTFAMAQGTTTSSSSSSTLPSSSSGGATTTSSSSGSADSAVQTVQVQMPPLITCEYATFTFSQAPANQVKYLGFFVEGKTSGGFVEIFTLPDVYTPLTNSTVQWLCDFPTGLAVGVEIFSALPNNTIPDGWHASTQTEIVAAGTSSNCVAENAGQNTLSLLSYASSLNPGYVAPTSLSNAAHGSSGKSTDVGPIVGGVVGGVLVILAIALFLLYLRYRHNNQRLGSAYGGSEKWGPSSNAGTIPPFSATGPAGAWIPYDEYGRPLVGPFSPPTEVATSPEIAPSTPVKTMNPGMLPEPMDAESDTRHLSNPDESLTDHSPPQTPATTAPFMTPSGDAFTPVTEGRDRAMGTEGLDDPSSFAPLRSPRMPGMEENQSYFTASP